ncbi:hypothetical protein LDENG_00146990 [Lucifuga dentata]|nr:hypothetical protein LDENG_00146990 [Lucifuga dentata]
MWMLIPLQSGGQTHYLLSSKDYRVGRKNCDIILPNDQSISRAHAVLTLTEQALTLKDTSKYGTFLNNQRLTENTPVDLKTGDSVTFGVFESKFVVDCQKLVVCSSCLDNDGKASLTNVLPPLGGKLVNAWTQDCTHLTMPSVKVTIKTISALLCCRPIVKPEFFSELREAIQQKLPPPKAESFIPEIAEPSLNKKDVNLGAIPARRQLFTGKTFLFLSAKQLKRLSTAVSLGGGRSQLLEEGSLPPSLLESTQSCVVDAITGSSQPLLPSSSTEWATSVKNILQRKGLRVITESEIGLAAIYASCDKYCNPSSVIPDSDSVQNARPRIPSASLSQTAVVEETVLAAASQKVTAYAVNTTEPSQGKELLDVTGVTTVGETPEKNQKWTTGQLGQSKHVAQKNASQFVVADTMSSSFNSVENTGSQWKKPEAKLPVLDGGNDQSLSQPSFSKTGMKTFPPKKSPQKQKFSAQTSPQKQSSLTIFFQPIGKKRPLEEELSALMSEPKRAALAETAPATRTQSPLVSGADLFMVRSETLSDRTSHTAQEELQGRKRKEMEAEIEMEELESIMSEDMDCFDEHISASQTQQAQIKDWKSAGQKQALNTAEPSSSNKRQRLHSEDNGRPNLKPQGDQEKVSGSTSNKCKNTEEQMSSFKSQQLQATENRTTNQMSSKLRVEMSSNKNHTSQPFKEEEISFIEDSKILKGEICQPKTEIPLKPITVKQEPRVSAMEEDLPKKLVLVEFRSLTVTAAPKAKPQQMQSSSYAKNFKRFHKIQVPDAEDSLHIIRGSDLLAHSRGKNSDLDEWLKDAAEEERQSRRDESIGDDLFRYNPTKLSKRR